MRELLLLAGAILVAATIAAACGGDSSAPTPTSTALNPADFSATIDNPLFPLSSNAPKVFEGEEKDPDTDAMFHTRIEHTVLSQTDTVAGIPVTVLQDKEYHDGQLVELTLDYFAQHRDGSVWYFGEKVDEYENGTVTGHSGQWITGEGNNRPGIYMPATPAVGQKFAQEDAPGIAEDQSEVIATGQQVTVPAGTFTGCIKTRDSSPLDDAVEFKYYCPQVGLTREEPPEGAVDLVSYQ
jgi:hypothetical protein